MVNNFLCVFSAFCSFATRFCAFPKVLTIFYFPSVHLIENCKSMTNDLFYIKKCENYSLKVNLTSKIYFNLIFNTKYKQI